jgi:hypothetical protein
MPLPLLLWGAAAVATAFVGSAAVAGIAEAEAEADKPDYLSPGCVIRDDRSFLTYGYHHYGIYSGNKNVIHFSDGIVKEESIDEFCSSFLDYIDVIGFSEKYIEDISQEESLVRAKSLIGMKGYDLLENNCEHFAVWCRTGQAVSSQAFGNTREEGYSASLSMSLGLIPIISKLYDKLGITVTREVCTRKIEDY